MLEHAHAKTKALRLLVQSTDSGLIQTAMTIQRQRRRRDNLTKLVAAAAQVRAVEGHRRALREASGTASGAAYGAVLDTVDDIKGVAEAPANLAQLECFRGLPKELAQTLHDLNREMAAHFRSLFEAPEADCPWDFILALLREEPELAHHTAAGDGAFGVHSLWEIVADEAPKFLGRDRDGSPPASPGARVS